MIHLYGKLWTFTTRLFSVSENGRVWCLPDTRTYNILISLYIKNNKVYLAAKHLARMKEAFLEPDVVSYRTLLYAYSGKENGSRSGAFQILS